MAEREAYFTADTFRFLRALRTNNRKAWFDAHRDRYEEHVREPALRFINDIGPHLRRLSPHLVADPSGTGGSLFRINRDVRFSDDATPYRTSVGMAFGLDGRGDSGSVGFYLYVEPGASWAGGGIRRPSGDTLRRLRDAIVAQPAAWRRAVSQPGFAATFAPDGNLLARPPRGYDPGHPFAVDLRRRTFLWRRDLRDAEVVGGRFMEAYLDLCRAAAPFSRFLARAVGESW